ncbi:MAG: GNAT family N-acetyltransferase [Acutalibacteraceae bacterium]
MIKKETDISVLSGASAPLLPLVYGEFSENGSAVNGLYIQSNHGKTTSVFSLKNSCATFCFTENCNTEELLSFFTLSGVTTVTYEYTKDIDFRLKTKEVYPLLKCTQKQITDGNVQFLNSGATLKDYKDIYSLLSPDGNNFKDWYPNFSKKINSSVSKCSYISSGNQIVSCAVASGVYGGNAVISGVATAENYRNKGCAAKCVQALLNNENTYLWCKSELTAFYTKIGFEKISNIIVGELY